MDLKNIRFTTIIVVIALLVISLYAVTEVTYFSAKNNAESHNFTEPLLSIPSIGVNEVVNNVSISQGVYHDKESYDPTKGDVVLFGHRTLQGSAFLRLDDLHKGDCVTLQWPGIGEINYTINDKNIVPASYRLNLNESHNKNINSQQIYLITCHPIGSASERLICVGNLNSTSLINESDMNYPNLEFYPWLITLGFFIFGCVVSFLFRDKEDNINQVIILSVVILLTIALVVFILFPGSSQFWANNLEWLNSLIGVN